MMRFLIGILLLTLVSFHDSYSQPAKDHFSLNGRITSADTKCIYLGYYDDEMQTGKTDSSFIRNGSFSFSGKLKQPAVGFISLKKGEASGLNATNIFLEPAEMSLDLTLNNFLNAHLTGSATQDDYEELRSKGDQIVKNHPQLFDSNGYIRKNLDTSLSEKLTLVYDTLDKIDYDYFDQHPTSYLTAYLLKLHTRNLSLDSLAMFYNRLGEDLKHHVVTETIRTRLKNIEVGSVGTVAPKFIAKDTSGNDFYSGFISEKYILLDFWASWCVPCRENSPYLIELYNKYKEKGLKIIGIADDRDTIKWKDAIEKDKTNLWIHVRREVNPDLKMKGLNDPNDVNEKFNISTLPAYILIDKYGVIIGRFQENLNDLDKLLQTSLK